MNRIIHRKVHHANRVPSSLHERRAIDKREYYWIWGYDGSRHIVFGAFQTYEEAQQKSMMLNFPSEVVKLPTRDEASASRILRARLLSKENDTDIVFERFRHTNKGA